jgi:DNA-binding transcriptional MerR regulator
MNIEAVSAKDAARICGFRSTAMLDYLQRTGVFVPVERKNGKRRGRGRRYTFRDMLVLRAISALLENGASVSSLGDALREFQSRRWTADETSLQGEGGSVLRYVVASGKSIIFATSRDTLFDLTKRGQMLFSFILDLDELHADLRTRCFEHRQRELPLHPSSS